MHISDNPHKSDISETYGFRQKEENFYKYNRVSAPFDAWTTNNTEEEQSQHHHGTASHNCGEV